MTSSAGWNSQVFRGRTRITANTWTRFSEENERIWRPWRTFDAGHKKTHFSEFAVFSAFCTKNGAVTLTGDIGKTFSGLKNLAVLQGFGTKNQNELGWYRQTFLTTLSGARAHKRSCSAAWRAQPKSGSRPGSTGSTPSAPT